MAVSEVVIVDTTVLLNVLNVPRRNQDHHEVCDQLEELVEAGANLLLPLAAVFETGNHIAQLPDGGQRRRHAEVFRDQVQIAVNGEAPWALIPLPDSVQLAKWLDCFPETAMRGVGMGDLSIIKAWEDARARHRSQRVWIWSLDRDLQGYDRAP